MGAMDDSDQNTLPALLVTRPVTSTHQAQQRLARWHSSRLPDQLRRVSRHPAVVGSLATAAGLLLEVGLRWAFSSRGQSERPAGAAILPTPSDGGSLVHISRTVVVETWTVCSRRT